MSSTNFARKTARKVFSHCVNYSTQLAENSVASSSLSSSSRDVTSSRLECSEESVFLDHCFLYSLSSSLSVAATKQTIISILDWYVSVLGAGSPSSVKESDPPIRDNQQFTSFSTSNANNSVSCSERWDRFCLICSTSPKPKRKESPRLASISSAVTRW